MQAVCLAGYWLDLWDHPKDKGCKVLKGVKEAIAEMPPQQESDEDAYPEVVDERKDQTKVDERLVPAKVR